MLSTSVHKFGCTNFQERVEACLSLPRNIRRTSLLLAQVLLAKFSIGSVRLESGVKSRGLSAEVEGRDKKHIRGCLAFAHHTKDARSIGERALRHYSFFLVAL